MTLLTLFIAVLLGLVHLVGGRFSFLEIEPRSRWLSAAGGVTVAFVFLFLLPELADFGQVLLAHHELGLVEELIYLTAAGGVVLFYGLEHLAFHARPHHQKADPDEPPFGHDYVFWVHMAWYALYNTIIGVLLSYGAQETIAGLSIYGLAMAIHFAVIDATMRNHHRHVYRATGRWLLAIAILVGWAVGAFLSIPSFVLALITAFLVGAMLVNAVKDELPSGKETRFTPFLVGALISAALLMLL